MTPAAASTEAKNGAEPPKANAKIDERIRWVQANVGAVEKTGHVEFGRTKYDVMQEHGIFAELHDLLDKAGLSTSFGLAVDVPDFYVKEGNAAAIICELVVRDDAGEARRAYYPAEGIDSADKASPKALTMASKYAYQKFFRVPTDKVDDADTTASAEHESKGTSGGASRPKGGRQKQQTNDKLAPQKVKVLRETAKAAVDAGHIDQKRIFASLQTHGVEKVEDLTKEQGDAFAKWLESELAGTPDATQLSTDEA
jgi:hypothetical protein